MIGLLFGVPIAIGVLSWDAEFSVAAITVGCLMPVIGMVAYLVTPLTPPEDPSEPPMPTIENVLPPTMAAIVSWPLNTLFAVKDWVMDHTLGAAMRLAGPWMAPFLPQVAFGIQISMGVSAVISAEEGFIHLTRVGAGVILLMNSWRRSGCCEDLEKQSFWFGWRR